MTLEEFPPAFHLRAVWVLDLQRALLHTHP